MPTSLSRRRFMNTVAASAALGTTNLSRAAGQASPGAARARTRPGPGPARRAAEVEHRNYRIASWWFRWEEFNYPDKGIQEKLRRRAAAFEAAGIDLALVFGLHCRWDYVYCFDRVHDLIRFSSDACHEHGIRLFDHYSATLVHRPRSMAGKWKLYDEGRNRLTFYPSADMAETLTWNSSRLNDWRMMRITENAPVFVEGYQGEMFCMNNPEFRKASADYLRTLKAETGIDGVQFDDGIYYTGWDSCGCVHCRRMFRERHGQDLPDWRDASFWGNYDNPHFRRWVRFRYDSTVEFLMLARDVLGDEFPLSACCCGTVAKRTDCAGQSIGHFTRAIDHVMLEMVGEISAGLIERVPEILVSRAAAVRRKGPVYGCGFAFYPEPAFLVWMLNKLFGLGSWVSAGKGRVNVTAAQMIEMPNEENIVAEPYNYEKRHADLFQGSPDCSLAILFSSDTKINHGDDADDYETAFRRLTLACFDENLPADVILSIDDARPYRVLALADVACLGDAERDALESYLREGGTVVAAGPLGIKNEEGDASDRGFLEQYGLHCRLEEPARPVDPQRFFTPNTWAWARQARSIPRRVSVETKLTSADGFYHVHVGRGHLHWSAHRLNDEAALPGFLNRVRRLVPAPGYRIVAPAGLQWRAFRNGTERVIHFMNRDFVPVPHPLYRYLKKPIAASLRHNPPGGELSISGEVAQAELFSPDLATPRRASAENGVIRLSLEGVRRFCSVRLR